MKNILKMAVVVVVAVGLPWFVWQWGFCRFYVGPDQMAVITAKMGDSLPPGQILAQKGQQGIQEDVLGEGRHFLNPWFYEREIRPVVYIPPGKVGIVTAKVGAELPEGEFLAERGQKGIWRNVLGPGKYRMNPAGYQIDVVDAISVPIGYDGVVTSLSGKQTPPNQFAQQGEKGVRSDVLQPGLYFVNPREYKVDVLEIGVNQVSLLGKGGGAVITKALMTSQNVAMDALQQNVLQEQQEKRADYMRSESSSGMRLGRLAPAPSVAARGGAAKDKKTEGYWGGDMAAAEMLEGKSMVAPDMPSLSFVLNQFVEFPSRDGFEISLDMTVEFELQPRDVAWIFRTYGDLPAAVDKVIMPQILSVSRLKGSAYGAKDFIVGEGREKFQNELTDALAQTLAEKRIVIHNALIRHVNVPGQILDPIQQASLAQEQDLTNQEKQNTAKKQAELNTGLSLIGQRREQVAQETEKIKALVKADEDKQVAEIQGDTMRQTAEVEQQTAGVNAERITTLGSADAEVVRLVEGEKAKGQQLKVKAFGDAEAYNLWTLALGIGDDLKINILHSGPGTLWTDLEKAGLSDLGAGQALTPKK
jgi:regulator of protease activity HflC (stomatin/prohibitin superfamily)